jgi:hypothetical protein
MRFRNTLILVAVVLALGAYVVFVELRAPSSQDKSATVAPTPLPPLESFAAGDARTIRLSRPGQAQRTELTRKDDGQWYVTVPVQEEANQEEVTRLAEDLATLQPQRVLTDTTGPLSDYELDPPASLVEVELASNITVTLKIGAQDAVGSGYYGQVSGDERIYLLPSYTASEVDRFLTTPPVKPTPEPTEPLVPTETPTVPA